MSTVRNSRRGVGDHVHVGGICGTYLVVSNDDPSLVTVESALGTRLRVAERAIVEVVSKYPDSPGSRERGGIRGGRTGLAGRSRTRKARPPDARLVLEPDEHGARTELERSRGAGASRVGVVTFGKHAQVLAKHARGETLSVVGSVQRNRLQDRDSYDRVQLQVISDSHLSGRTVRPGGDHKQGTGAQASRGPSDGRAAKSATVGEDFDDEFPF